MIVRQPRPRTVLVGLALASVLALAACGGGGSSKASGNTAPSTTGTNSASTTEASGGGGGNSNCYTTPGDQHAKVRFVNLFTNSAYPQGDIDVWQGYGASDGCGKKLATIKYGEASDYIDVTAADQDGNWSATVYVPGGADQAHQIINQSETWKGGEQVTIVFTTNDPANGQPAHTGSVSAVFEKDPASETTFAAVPGKGVLGVSANALQYVDKDGVWIGGIAGQSACLLGPGDTESTRTNVGGNVAHRVPGSARVGRLRAVREHPGQVHRHARDRARDNQCRSRLPHARVRVRTRQAAREAAGPARRRLSMLDGALQRAIERGLGVGITREHACARRRRCGRVPRSTSTTGGACSPRPTRPHRPTSSPPRPRVSRGCARPARSPSPRCSPSPTTRRTTSCWSGSAKAGGRTLRPSGRSARRSPRCTAPVRRASAARTGAAPGAADCPTSRARRGPSSTRPTGCSRSPGWRVTRARSRTASIAAMERLAGRLEQLGGPAEPPARLHGDLWAGNRLIDADGRNWLIDPAAHGGHREFDLAMMRLFGGFGEACFAAYADAFPLADGWEERVPLHQIAPLAVHTIKFGGGYVSAASAAIARYS